MKEISKRLRDDIVHKFITYEHTTTENIAKTLSLTSKQISEILHDVIKDITTPDDICKKIINKFICNAKKGMNTKRIAGEPTAVIKRCSELMEERNRLKECGLPRKVSSEIDTATILEQEIAQYSYILESIESGNIDDYPLTSQEVERIIENYRNELIRIMGIYPKAI
ncbi:MAG: hypothetical protein N2749_05175 [Clostridia bacterium]|nr:hypothetical protein [Clostridia bacterium]